MPIPELTWSHADRLLCGDSIDERDHPVIVYLLETHSETAETVARVRQLNADIGETTGGPYYLERLEELLSSPEWEHPEEALGAGTDFYDGEKLVQLLDALVKRCEIAAVPAARIRPKLLAFTEQESRLDAARKRRREEEISQLDAWRRENAPRLKEALENACGPLSLESLLGELCVLRRLKPVLKVLSTIPE